MKRYYKGLYAKEIYTVTDGTDVDCSNFEDGIGKLDLDTGLYYVCVDGAWTQDKSKYNMQSYNSEDELINLADLVQGGTLLVEDLEEKYFREGYVYCVGHRWINVGAGNSINIHLKTGSKPIYMNFYVNGVALSDYEAITNPIIGTEDGDEGEEITPFNRNSRKGNDPLTEAYIDATFTGGDICVERFFGSSGNAIQREGGFHSSQNAIFNENSHYIFRMTNSNTSTQERMGIVVDWIEFDTEL